MQILFLCQLVIKTQARRAQHEATHGSCSTSHVQHQQHVGGVISQSMTQSITIFASPRCSWAGSSTVGGAGRCHRMSSPDGAAGCCVPTGQTVFSAISFHLLAFCEEGGYGTLSSLACGRLLEVVLRSMGQAVPDHPTRPLTSMRTTLMCMQ